MTEPVEFDIQNVGRGIVLQWEKKGEEGTTRYYFGLSIEGDDWDRFVLELNAETDSWFQILVGKGKAKVESNELILSFEQLGRSQERLNEDTIPLADYQREMRAKLFGNCEFELDLEELNFPGIKNVKVRR
eukprot:TRINITY_DN4531_c0_g1_i2.p1 TRINITY_DN4531_c0_g1~~TRINITY_DN4531_c0_g1_i2.p1  ORF type:complete len:131 (-),score=23.75 TRINITY_DN4531_c0_g1_i2:203-595(-)